LVTGFAVASDLFGIVVLELHGELVQQFEEFGCGLVGEFAWRGDDEHVV